MDPVWEHRADVALSGQKGSDRALRAIENFMTEWPGSDISRDLRDLYGFGSKDGPQRFKIFIHGWEEKKEEDEEDSGF